LATYSNSELLIATTNPGKLREISSILDGLPIRLRTLADFPGTAIADETGSTFAENARQKALHYAAETGMKTMAEDSGFVVDALGGEPGIYSARYLREDATYQERFDDIYRRIALSPSTSSGSGRPASSAARFVCALVVAENGVVVFETTAAVDGLLADSPSGANGFGYDPVFYYPPYGRTFGEVSDDEKTAVSHRGQAMRAFRAYLAAGLHSAPSWPK
jgi:XTP/dITP diphosphohydrolase